MVIFLRNAHPPKSTTVATDAVDTSAQAQRATVTLRKTGSANY